MRELHEECGLSEKTGTTFAPEPFTVTDVIVPEENGDGFQYHYMLAQTFAVSKDGSTLQPGDDAGAAAWYSFEELEKLRETGQTTQDVVDVVRRGLLLHERGLLEPT